LLDLAAPGSEDRVFGLAVPRELVDTLVEKLSKHAIMDEVEIQSDNDLAFVLVAGDSRPEISANLRLSRVEYPISGWLIWGTNTELAALFEAPHEDATDMFCAMRIDENQPAWGYEVRGDIFPPEAGFVAAVSYEKGCYLGQEPLARIHARGQTNWVMAKVRALDGEPTTCELATADRPKAGTVTTVAASQTDRLALAIVHRKVAQAGQILFCSDAPEQRWEIVVAPIGADVRPAKA
jgi:folate-binding protein YgfZ